MYDSEGINGNPLPVLKPGATTRTSLPGTPGLASLENIDSYLSSAIFKSS